MPPVLFAVGAAVLSAGVGVAIGAVTIGSAIAAVATTAITAGVSYLLTPSIPRAAADGEAPAPAQANHFRQVVTRQAVPHRKLVYGRVRRAGDLFFEDNVNPHLYRGILLSDGPIEGVEQIYFGDTVVPLDGSGNASAGTIHNGSLSAEFSTGTAGQTASTMLLGAFPDTLTSDFRQLGVARAVLKYHWGDDSTEHNVLWGNSIDPTFLMKGRLCYDPREVGHDIDDNSTWDYTTNPALCIADALTHMGWNAISPDLIDWASVTSAANTCDETVAYGEAMVAQFTFAGIFVLGEDVPGQVQEMLSAMNGAFYFDNGVYKLRADTLRTSVWTIEDADIIGISEFAVEGDVDTTPTAIRARFFDSDSAGEDSMTPVYQSALVSSEGYREKTLSLPFTAQSHSAQIIAYRHMAYAQDGRAVNLTLHDAAISLEPFDVITISSQEIPSLNGKYRVMQRDMVAEGVLVTLQGMPETAYVPPSDYLQ